MSRIREEERVLADYTILSEDGAEFPVHKIFLAAQSPPIMAKITLDMEEERESKMRLEYEAEVVRHFVGNCVFLTKWRYNF